MKSASAPGCKPGEMLNMLDGAGRLVQCGGIPDELVGLDRFEARKQVVELLDAAGALVKVEDRTIATPYGDRSGVVIEPWLTDQWYVDAATLVKPVIEATRSGAIKIVPETWAKTWFNWLENIQPWCVSRQLWWGHRIPAWFDDDGNIFVAETVEAAQAQAGEGVALRQDDDVLDTWFSSALWPFATLGWPEPTKDLARHYPNDVLISGFDILFFWDARMAMQGIEFMKEVPWKTLYLHGLVRDAAGQKMSKSKGNTVDPLGLIDQYGADALRFFMAAMESQGRDIKMDESAPRRLPQLRHQALERRALPAGQWRRRVAQHRRARGRRCRSTAGSSAKSSTRSPSSTRRSPTCASTKRPSAIYHFTWATFCDWYVELVKGAWDDETRAVAAWAFDQILVMLHPFMPFITEELWHSMGERPYELIVAKWPAPEASARRRRGEADRRHHRHRLRSPRAARRTQHPVERGAGPDRDRRRCGDARPLHRQCRDAGAHGQARRAGRGRRGAGRDRRRSSSTA